MSAVMSMSTVKTVVCLIVGLLNKNKTRVSDPDPEGSGIFSGVGSGSVKKSRIRILLSKNDPKFGIFISKNGSIMFLFSIFFLLTYQLCIKAMLFQDYHCLHQFMHAPFNLILFNEHHLSYFTSRIRIRIRDFHFGSDPDP